jgi:hypothetical protein
LYGKRI